MAVYKPPVGTKPATGGLMTPAQYALWARSNRAAGDYNSYVNWVQRTRLARAQARPVTPAPTDAVVPRPLAPNPNAIIPGLGITRAAQNWLQSQVNQQITASEAGAKAAMTLQQQQADQQAARAQNYALALAQLTKPDSSVIGQAYTDAANRLNAYGTGMTGSVADAQRGVASQVQAALAAQGTPAVETAKVGSYDPTQQQAVNQFAGVVIPGTTLDTQRAASMAEAEMGKAAGTMNIQNIVGQYLAKKQQAADQYAAAISQTEAQRPTLWQKAYSDYSSQQQQQRALDVQIGTLRLQMAKTAQDRALALTQVTGNLWLVGRNGQPIDTGRPAPGTTGNIATARNANQAAIASANRQVQQEIADARNTTAITVANTAAAARKAAATTAAQVRKSGKPATAAQRATILKGAYADGAGLTGARVARIKRLIPQLDSQRPNESNPDYIKRFNYGVNLFNFRVKKYYDSMVTNVINLLAPRLKLLGYGPQQIQAYAQAVVASNAQAPKPKAGV
jgi:hypothetical protein